MATFSYEQLENRYNPYTKQIELIDVSKKELDQFKASIDINKDNIDLKVSSDEIISQINLSTEGIYIGGDNIELDGNVNVQGSFSINSIQDAGPLASAGYIDTNNLSSYTPSTNGVYITSQGITGVYNSQETFKLNTNDGSASFKGNIEADSGHINGTLSIDGAGTLQSSDYALSNSFQPASGWKLDDDGLYIGIGKNIFLGGSGYFLVGSGNEYISIGGDGIEFQTYAGSNNGYINGGFGNIEILGGTSSSFDYIRVSDNLRVGGAIIADNHIVMQGTADLHLVGTSNRIKSGAAGQIYYNGTIWKKIDASGESPL